MKYISAALSIIIFACYENPSSAKSESPDSTHSKESISEIDIRLNADSIHQYNMDVRDSIYSAGIYEIAFEIGRVCVSFNIDSAYLISSGDALNALSTACNAKPIITTMARIDSSAVIASWIADTLLIPRFTAAEVQDDIIKKSESIRFYRYLDGSMRYIYVEVVGDNRGLMKFNRKGEL